MKKNSIFILILILIFIIPSIFSAEKVKITENISVSQNKSPGDQDSDINPKTGVKKNEVAKKEYDEAYKKWTEGNINNYYMKILYGAFSPMGGVWDIYVEDGVVVKLLYEGEECPEHFEKPMSEVTMEYLFELASRSYQNEDEALFVHTAQYDSEIGYVTFTNRIQNPGAKVRPPTDRSYKYVISEFKKLN